MQKGFHFRMAKIGEFPDLWQNFRRNLYFIKRTKNGILVVKSFGTY